MGETSPLVSMTKGAMTSATVCAPHNVASRTNTRVGCSSMAGTVARSICTSSSSPYNSRMRPALAAAAFSSPSGYDSPSLHVARPTGSNGWSCSSEAPCSTANSATQSNSWTLWNVSVKINPKGIPEGAQRGETGAHLIEGPRRIAHEVV